RDGKIEGTILKLKQDVPTRWNSTFYMIERFLLLREYIYPVMLKCPTFPEMITNDKFEILKDVITILQPIELVTKKISGDKYPTVSIIIPIIRCMKESLSNCIPTTNNVHRYNFKRNILSEIERRFHNIERYNTLVIATLLDPRFKKLHFRQPLNVSSAISRINILMQDLSKNTNSETISISSRDENNITQGLWSFHDNLAALPIATTSDDSGMHLELRQYLHQSVIPRHSNPLQYWQTLKAIYPILFKIAKQYLAVVATSVPAERLFSKAGLIKSDIRNRLKPSRLNSLLFLQSVEYEDWKHT
ncbi:Zinc finger BED domain-containing protein 4, partial [Cyphomyrmex costatus]